MLNDINKSSESKREPFFRDVLLKILKLPPPKHLLAPCNGKLDRKTFHLSAPLLKS